jgi:hypothetical protein
LIEDKASISRKINADFTLKLSAYEKELKSNYFQIGNVVKADNQKFDIQYIEQTHSLDGEVAYNIECEHVFYRLNTSDYELNHYVYNGTPTQVLSNLLSGTGFSVGALDFTTVMTFIINERMTKAGLVIQLANQLGGELEFTNDGFTVGIRNTIGQDNGFQIRFGKNLKGVSKVVDNRGGLKTSYAVDILTLKNSQEYQSKGYNSLEFIGLGDTVKLIDEVIGLNVVNRIVAITYNPVFEVNTDVEIANTINLIADRVTQIERTTVAKESVYNGIKIGPDEGYVAERSDGKAKTIMNATEGISIYSDLGSGLVRNFFVDTNGRIQGKSLDIDGNSVFHGKVDVTNGDIDVLINPGGTTAFQINNNTTELFKVDTSGNATLKQVTLRNDLVGSNYLNISPSGMFAWDASNSRKTFEIDSSGKAYFRGDITSDAVITGATIRSGAVGTNRIELSAGIFRGLTDSGQKTGLYFDISTIAGTGIADLFLYHNNTKLVDFYDNITSYSIKGSSSSTGLILGGSSATTYAEGSWDFNYATIYNLITNSAGSHSHSGGTGSYGGHNHGISPGTVLLTDTGSVVWVAVSDHWHSISSDGSHSHTVQSN